MKEDQNYASRLKNIFMNSLFLWLFCFHHDSCTSLSLFLLWDHQKSLFSALCACLLHTSLPLCMLLSAAVFVYSQKWLLTRKPHFCFSIQKKFQLSQMMPNYKVLSCVSNKTSVTLWETEKLIFFTFCYRSFRFFTTTVKKTGQFGQWAPRTSSVVVFFTVLHVTYLHWQKNSPVLPT